MLAKHTTQRVIDCTDCEATGYANEPGNIRCGLCGGACQLVVTTPETAPDEELWEEIHALRVKRMPHIFGDEADQPKESSMDAFEEFNNKLWQGIAEQAMTIADSMQNASIQLEGMRDQLSQLIAIAADTPAPVDGGEQVKRETIKVWRATLAQVERMISALDQSVPS
jgi:hypothetical protein